MLCWNISSGISLSPTGLHNSGDNMQNVILLMNEMGLKEGEVLLSDSRGRAWDFGVCLWNACSPASSLGGVTFQARGGAVGASPAAGLTRAVTSQER